jgi:aspartate carbamoyltransferase catalytic subunit
MRHVLEARQFSDKDIDGLFKRADELQDSKDKDKIKAWSSPLAGKLLFTVFYEPSTRTRISFSSAALHLGMQVVGTENAREFSSASKGETIEDTIKVLCQYRPDAIVLRHHETGAAKKAAAVSSVPIINAGDGMGEHPTQALLDLYTIQRELGRNKGLNIVMGGDLAHGRTVRSLAQLITLYPGNHLTFLSPPGLEMGEDIKELLKNKKVSFNETQNIEKALRPADVVYWTRVQKERFDAAELDATFVIDTKEMTFLKKKSVLMHPLPRVDEITTGVDVDPRAAYFRQAGNGMFIRMALLEWVLSSGQ